MTLPAFAPTDAPIRARMSVPACLAGLALALSLAACGGGGGSGGSNGTAATDTPAATTPAPAEPASNTTEASAPPTPAKVALGEALFNDPSLSASGRQSCASCHVAANAHADPAGTLLPVGGLALDRQGTRSSPSLHYLGTAGAFRFDAAGKPVGGFTWDGRAASRKAQAAGPLTDLSEMANASVGAVAARARATASYPELARLYGLSAAASDSQVMDALTQALEDYQAGDTDYVRFNSKYDRVLDGSATLSAQEARGLAVFEDPARGNCASCHTSRPAADGRRPLFTSFGYAALGLPRNAAISANADPAFFDMGLCGPKRTDLASRTDLCGQFRIPTLRNVALTAPYFHNAAADTLARAVSFYATRDLDPARWYPLGTNGRPDKFDDLPTALRGNVVQTAPFGLAPGAPPRITAQDSQDLVAFLNTLTDDATAPVRSAFVGR